MIFSSKFTQAATKNSDIQIIQSLYKDCRIMSEWEIL